MEIIDLHIHTNKSDGILDPKEIIDTAKKNKIKLISITDHDTTEAYTKKLLSYAKYNDIKIVTGVEISTRMNNVGIHVLGYNIDVNNLKLNETLNKLRNSRHIYLYDVSQELSKLGYKVEIDKLDKIDAVSKAHIALNIINNKENEKLLLKTFNHIPSKGEFIETIMNEGCPAYVLKTTITPKEASILIKDAGGKVILAHPVAYKYEDDLKETDILKIIKDMNADGIESNYIYIDKGNNVIDEIEFWNKFANRNNLITTIGSDFHNSDGIHPEIGLINKKINYSLININKILENLLN